MAHDPEATANLMAMAVKAALAPVLERIALTETKLAQMSALDQAVLALRDRVTVTETKAATLTVPELPAIPALPDLTPIMERLAAAEARIQTLGDLRDRVVTVETKAAQPLPEPQRVDVRPLLDRLSALELKSAETAPVVASVAELAKECSALRERVAVAEVRTGVPGPAGKDGKDGKDGADGFGFEDIVAEQVDERTMAFKGVRGDRVKEFGRWKARVMLNRGVWLEGKSYEAGDVVTWGGSQWHANEDTSTKPGEDAKAWTLVVKRGRDGRDGKDAMTLPVVKVNA